MGKRIENFAPQGDGQYAFKLRCPRDGSLMEKIPIGSLAIERCGRCGCMWFDRHELQLTLASDTEIENVDTDVKRSDYLSDVTNVAQVVCPRDGEALVEMSDPAQKHVRVDCCRACGGVLLDPGELKDLSRLTLRERLAGFFRKP
jgi:Zn-finger nucleic acid-binding protein